MVQLPAADIRRAVRAGLEEDLAKAISPRRPLLQTGTGSGLDHCPAAHGGRRTRGGGADLSHGRSLLSVLTTHTHDGDRIPTGAALLDIEGDGRSILQAERVALNFLQHLSGIATLTNGSARPYAYPAQILDTRKTLPGWRSLQKWAVSRWRGHQPPLLTRRRPADQGQPSRPSSTHTATG